MTDVLDAISRAGLSRDDVRLRETMKGLEPYSPRDQLSCQKFCELVRPNILLVEQALQDNVVIPDFVKFCAELERIFEETKENLQGKVADYIPQLSRVDPELYAVALCTIDGQRFSLGDTEEDFCVQSACKPISYCLALEEHGEDYVHRYIGREPSGQVFNELTLSKEGKPHNPMINAGAIMSGSMIGADLDPAGRFDYVLERWRALCGGEKVGFDNSVYQSERNTADRNFALGYYMREHKAFPDNADMLQALEFYLPGLLDRGQC